MCNFDYHAAGRGPTPETSSSNIYYPHSWAQNYTDQPDDEVADDVNTMKSETDEAVQFASRTARPSSRYPTILLMRPEIFAVMRDRNYGAPSSKPSTDPGRYAKE